MKRRILAGLGLAVAAVGIYTAVVEPRWLELRRSRVHIRGLHPGLEGLRIGLLTDLHAGGGGTSLRTVRKAARMVMSEAPDVIALTGDFAAHSLGHFTPVLDALRELEAPLGVYVVPGNHEHRMGIAIWDRDIRQFPQFVDLTNHSLVLDVKGAQLCIAGVDDLAHGQPSLESLPERSRRDLTILLAHNPDQAELSRRSSDGIDLILSGHTHGGQIRIPGVGPLRSSVEHADLYEDGLRRRPWTQVYTSRGVGMVRIPVRLFTRPEVAVLELTGAARPQLKDV